jgi:dipeptidyl aminopeptidase/acylaminoacyl peptidase
MLVSKLRTVASMSITALAFAAGAAVSALQDEGGSDRQGNRRPGAADKGGRKFDSTTPAPSRARPIDRAAGAKLVDAGVAVDSLAWSPGGKLLATRATAWSPTGDGGTLKTGRALQIRDVETGAVLRTLYDEDDVSDVRFSPDGRSVAAALAGENVIKLWDPWTGKGQRTFEGTRIDDTAAATLFRIAFSRDGRLLAAAGRVNDVFARENNAMVYLWETGSGKLLWQARGHSLLNPEPAVAFSADGKLLATGAHGTIKLWNTATGECSQTLEGVEDGGASSLAFSPDGKLLASGGDGKVRLWDPDSRELKRVLTTGYSKGLNVLVAFSPDGRRLAVGGTTNLDEASGDVQLFDSKTGRLEQAFPDLLRRHGAICALAFSPGGETLAVGTWNKKLLLLAVASAPADAQEVPAPAVTPARRLPGRYAGFEPSVAAHPGGRVLVAAMDYSGNKPNDSRASLIAWRSGDRGATWSEPRSIGNERDQRADVWLQADPRGGFLAAYLQAQGRAEAGLPCKAVFQRSEDGGETWKEARVLGRDADRTVLAMSPSGRHLAVAFVKGGLAVVLRSEDRGEHWQKVPRGVVDRTRAMSGLGVNDDGAIAAAWTVESAIRGLDDRPHWVRKLVVTTTKDDGGTWKDVQLGSYTDSQVGGPFGGDGEGLALALDGSGVAHAVHCYPAGHKKDYRLLYRRSTDLQTWSDPVPLSSGDVDDVRGFPAIAAASSRVHVTWMEQSGGIVNVWYRGSIDGGLHWSKPLRLSRPEQPTDLLTAAGFKSPGGHYMSIAEDGRGTSHAAWGVVAAGQPGGEIWHCAVRLRPEEGRAK